MDDRGGVIAQQPLLCLGYRVFFDRLEGQHRAVRPVDGLRRDVPAVFPDRAASAHAGVSASFFFARSA